MNGDLTQARSLYGRTGVAARSGRQHQGVPVAQILCAEDESDLADLIRSRLTMDGHDVTTVHDGQAALDACRRRRPDALLLDVVMPGPSDGLDVLRTIRGDDRLADLPVIVLTALAFERDIRTGMSAGADLYITKPFSPRDLAKRISDLLVATTT